MAAAAAAAVQRDPNGQCTIIPPPPQPLPRDPFWAPDYCLLNRAPPQQRNFENSQCAVTRPTKIQSFRETFQDFLTVLGGLKDLLCFSAVPRLIHI